MNDYVEVKVEITPFSEDFSDLLAAELAEVGYESFVTDSEGLTAYVRNESYDRVALDGILSRWPYPCRLQLREALTIEGRDWNHEWEKNYFKPIVIGDECVVHSSFHTDYPTCRYDIAIDPKMAFGTGHHATTSLIVTRLLTMPVDGLKVVDMGTGTGILAILSRMRGAGYVVAVEIDPMACENTRENVLLNGCGDIDVRLGDVTSISDVDDADILLANINRNIITADMPAYAAAVKSGGQLVFSGFYEADVPVVEEAASRCGLKLADVTSCDGWASVRFVKE
ncbi:50S ribosomal protein L11 methyltransferase [Paramuribaculum intestinale]|uniref:50S ribosomal protein L11 methyltransferase n=1 Tax=Paramuribaculum intestinale TaxID=2094151 RepID=UPI00259CC73E|nr:50S ribosomal protein L11 methyltransferase [Paramuribaculum intestinale]